MRVCPTPGISTRLSRGIETAEISPVGGLTIATMMVSANPFPFELSMPTIRMLT